MTIDEAIAILRREWPRLAHEYYLISLGVFGSLATGRHGAASDCDVLVSFSKSPGLFRFIDLEDELSALLGTHVDLVEQASLKPGIGKRVMKEVVAV